MRYLYFLFLFACLSLQIYSQDNLDSILNSQSAPEINYTNATFKSTSVMNGQSIERMPQGQLDFRIHHRFSQINSGPYNFFGLDGATTHFSLEYGITDWFMAGAGRGNLEKTFDAFGKFSLWRQSTGAKNMPVSISYFTSVALRTEDFPFVDSVFQNNSTYPFSTRFSYVNQILIARKFNNNFSLQISPTLIHYNIVKSAIDPNNLFAIGIGGRMKLTNRVSINAEYFYAITPLKDYLSVQYRNSLSIGFDIETGGHVFQLIFTNADGMIEKDFIGRTTGRWDKGDIHFGFNISRVFDINHHH